MSCVGEPHQVVLLGTSVHSRYQSKINIIKHYFVSGRPPVTPWMFYSFLAFQMTEEVHIQAGVFATQALKIVSLVSLACAELDGK